jgi:hypothetical protein
VLLPLVALPVVLLPLPLVLTGVVDSLPALVDEVVFDTGVDVAVCVVAGWVLATSVVAAGVEPVWCAGSLECLRVTRGFRGGADRFADVSPDAFRSRGLLANSIGGITTANPVSRPVLCVALRAV